VIVNQRLNRWALGSLAIALIIFIWSLWHRIIHIDDVWLAEYSYWLAQLGYVKSEALRGFFEAENKLYVYHKLLAIEGALAIRLFGFDPYVLKSIALVFLTGSLWLLRFVYLKHLKGTANVYLLFALFLSFFHTMNLGFTFRPELHLVFWGLFSYIFLEKFLDGKNEKYALLLAGVFSGVGIATHLNGVVFTGATVAFLWFHRRWTAGFIFGVVASWGIFFYFLIDAHSLAEIKMSFYQLTHWRDVATGKYGWEVWFRLITEQGRYLHSPPEILYSLLLVVLLFLARKVLWVEQRRLVIYTALLFFFVAHVTHGVNTNYLLYCLPFFILLATYSFEILIRQKRSVAAVTAVVIFLVGSWVYNISEFSHKEETLPEVEKVAAFLPADVQVLAPAALMFPGLGKFRIQSFINYRDNVEYGKMKANPEDLIAEAIKYKTEYIVFDQSSKLFFKIDSDSYGPFKLMETQPSEKFFIYKASY
jgi:hypothetical protein